jgi:hypothetical protein
LQTFMPNAHEMAQKNAKCILILHMSLRINFFIPGSGLLIFSRKV